MNTKPLIVFLSKAKTKLVIIKTLFTQLNLPNETFHHGLKKALKDILIESINDEESKWIAEIESLRDKLNSSTDEIEILTNYNVYDDNEDVFKLATNTIGYASKVSSISFFWAYILFKIVRTYKPKVCFELGTNIGISAAYQAAALKLNNAGRLTTFELSDSKVNLARSNFKVLHLDNIDVIPGRFNDTLKNELIKQQPIDYVFIDGHHDGDATVEYFNLITPYLSEKSILIFDDINWSEGMKMAWEIIRKDKRLTAAIDLNRLGICLIDNTTKK